MPDGMQSIEDLISASQGNQADEDTEIGQFQVKQNLIKLNEVERATESRAQASGLPYISLARFPISPEAISLIEEVDAIRMKAVCFYFDGDQIRIGTTEVNNHEVANKTKELNEKYHAHTEIYLISENSLKKALNLYSILPKIRKFVSGVQINPEEFEKYKNEIKDYRVLNTIINKVNISAVVTLILATAMKTGASDIHIEAEEGDIIVRLRIDGVLHEAAVIEKDKWKKIISRMKLLSKVKINVTEKPQDGRFTIFLTEDRIDVRVSFLPTAFGESVVMRLLKSSSVGLPFEKLGIMPTAYEILDREIKKPNGLVLTTGPTGSGKTTTLYAILNKLNDPETKIITMEDPVEYKLKGINQSQVEASKGYTFAKGLRSILRQDPDVVMVGEMRDLETSEIAVQASLTGHLVLSTLHTNDAAGVIPRLIEMGVKPFLIVPSVNCIIGQRLLRKLCDKCKVEQVLDEDEEEKVRKILSIISPRAGIEIPTKLPPFYKANETGCEICGGIGFKGRVGIYEIFTMNNEIKQLTADNAPAFKILEQAIESGMVTMLQDGVLKAMEGRTSLEEVYRVIGKFEYVDALYDIVISKTIGRGVKITPEHEKLGADYILELSTISEKLSKLSSRDLMPVILAASIKGEVSDIHVDPAADDVRVRFRFDGILHDVASITKEQYMSLLSSVKLLAGFSTNIKKPTYDGRFSINLKSTGAKIDCRVSIISGGFGETVVIRILASQAANLDIEKLGFRGVALAAITRAIKKTKGVIITTGPTGSGKTTTLYSLLNKINSPDVKIITIEDPIEYQLGGVMQTQVNTEEGYTFAASLRSLMRQNPNVIMVGEIRDDETAKTAIEAALTGHLVLSTIHANSAAGAINRFVGLKVERTLLSGSIECSIGQRLVRKICSDCKTETEVSSDVIQDVKKVLDSINPVSGIEIPAEYKFFKGKGCEKCKGLGYRGRVGLYEVIEMTSDLQKIILQPTSTNFDIEQEAMKGGTLLMLQDGVLKALAGETTIDEIFRVAR